MVPNVKFENSPNGMNASSCLKKHVWRPPFMRPLSLSCCRFDRSIVSSFRRCCLSGTLCRSHLPLVRRTAHVSVEGLTEESVLRAEQGRPTTTSEEITHNKERERERER